MESISISNHFDKEQVLSNKQYNLEQIKKYFGDDYKQYLRVFDYSDIQQRSQQWFQLRKMTASTILKAVQEKEMPQYILEQSSLIKNYVSNEHTCHGKNFEALSTAFYKNFFNSDILEVSIVPHKKYDFIGATPDGFSILKGKYYIQEQLQEVDENEEIEDEEEKQPIKEANMQDLGFDEDNSINIEAKTDKDQKDINIPNTIAKPVFIPMVEEKQENYPKARLLEIKCPTTRVIFPFSDKIFDICKYDYLAQCWLQLECCEMKENDFWQTKIRIFDNLKELQQNYNDKEQYNEEQFKKLHQGYYDQRKKKDIIEIRPIVTINDDKRIGSFDVLDFDKMDKITFKGPFIILCKHVPLQEKKENHQDDPYDLEYIIDLDLKKTYNEQYKQMKELYKQLQQEQQINGFIIYKEQKWKVLSLKFWRFDHGHLITINENKGWIKNNIHKMQETWNCIQFLKNNQNCWQILNSKFEQEFKTKFMEKKEVYQPKYNKFMQELRDMMTK